MSPAKKQTQATEQADIGADSIPATLAEGEIVIAAADLPVNTDEPIIIPEDQFEQADEEQPESTELTSFRAAAEFFKALNFEYEDTFDIHVDKSGIRAFVRHPQNGMQTAKFISFQEIPLVKRQAIVDEVNGVTEDEGE